MSAPSTLSDPILGRLRYQSRLHPAAIAVSSGGREVRYGAFVGDIDHLSRHLQRHLPPDWLATGPSPTPRRVVAIQIADPYLHWVTVIALMQLAVPSESLASQQPDAIGSLNPGDLLLTDLPTGGAKVAALAITPDLLQTPLDDSPQRQPSSESAAVRADNDPPLRIVYSSGTTGQNKRVLLTRERLLIRLRNIAYTYDISSATRYLDAVPITAICGFHLPLATWCAGGTVLMAPWTDNKYQTLLRTRATLTFDSPITLLRLLESIPTGSRPIDGLKVFVGGSLLPPAISQRARQQLTPALYLIYGSTEASLTAYAHASIADQHPGAVGHALPFVDVQTVDPAGQPTAAGVPGVVRIRGEGCVAGYLDDPALSAEVFRDGWFYPGDYGVLNENGDLQLIGRTRELMNLGGFKLSPDQIENALRETPGITDLAAFALDDAHGIDCPWLCVVPAPDYQESKLVDRYLAQYRYLPPLHLMKVSAIPRNAMGKIQREVLRNLARTQMNKPARP